MLVLLLAALSGPARADPMSMNIRSVTPGEMALLPPYCVDVDTWSRSGSNYNPSVAQQRWIAMMGRTFWALHHYCWALLKAHRAQNVGLAPVIRTGLLASAIGDANYVIEQSTPDFPLAPEIHLRIGQFNLALERYPEALEAWDRSRAIKPDYWPPYVEIANLNLRLGRRDQALAVLNEGLRHMPDERRLHEAIERARATSPSADRGRAGERP